MTFVDFRWVPPVIFRGAFGLKYRGWPVRVGSSQKYKQQNTVFHTFASYFLTKPVELRFLSFLTFRFKLEAPTFGMGQIRSKSIILLETSNEKLEKTSRIDKSVKTIVFYDEKLKHVVFGRFRGALRLNDDKCLKTQHFLNISVQKPWSFELGKNDPRKVVELPFQRA